MYQGPLPDDVDEEEVEFCYPLCERCDAEIETAYVCVHEVSLLKLAQLSGATSSNADTKRLLKQGAVRIGREVWEYDVVPLSCLRRANGLVKMGSRGSARGYYRVTLPDCGCRNGEGDEIVCRCEVNDGREYKHGISLEG